MNYILNSGLPEKNVKVMLCDCRVEGEILTELKYLKIDTVLVGNNKNIDTPVSAHPDMNILHLGKNEFITSKEYSDSFKMQISEIKLCEKNNNRRVEDNLTKKYPGDVKLNAVIIDKYLICNPKTVDNSILNSDKKIIAVSQGYTKCSVAIVSDNAIITDDESIYLNTKNIFDVLLIKKGSVLLNGYNYGFIGGCCGKISKKILAFTGNIKTINEYDNIKSFCRNHQVDLICLSSKPLYDYGSLIPIIEN